MKRRVSAKSVGDPKEKLPVADDNAKESSPFDVQTVEALVALMSEHNLSEIDLRDGVQRVRLRRGARQVLVPGAAAAAPVGMPHPGPAPAATQPGPAEPSRKLLEIKSETVGTFYAAANPESPPYVKVGSRVEATTVVGLIEAMKLFNEIQAGVSGVVEEVLVENKQPVEFGQVLFRVNPSA
jgi:acetyl-CoA carboxylase biotin carboxyl carrier protein